MKYLKFTPDQQNLWEELCQLVSVNPEWLKKTIQEYYRVAEEHGLMEMDDGLLNAKYEFGWIEHAIEFLTE